MHGRRGVTGASVAALAVIVLAGCGGSTDDPAAPLPTMNSTTTTAAPEPVGGLVAELGTNRLYVVDRGFGLALRNVTDEPIVVQSMQLDSPEFVTAAANEREVTLAPGRRLVLPLPYGEARCDVEAHEPFSVVVVLAGGEELRLDAAEEYAGAVARLHRRECAAAEVLDRVDITFGDDWAKDGITISGELRLEQRQAGEPVAIDDAAGNVIFTLLVEDEHPVVRVSDEEPSASVPVRISADRCDPHAVAEFKRPFVFLSWVAIGDGPAHPVELELTGGARAALVDLLATCSV